MPQSYFEALLADMSNAFPNSVRDKRHLLPPVWKETCQVLHYRDYYIRDVVAALEQRSGLTLNLKKSYLGDKEIADCTKEQTGRHALEAAKAKAHSPTANQTPTQHIQIVVGYGEGRATRKFELIWWPEMFSSSKHGKLTLRFYVSKVII